jgi:hypothetical protein
MTTHQDTTHFLTIIPTHSLPAVNKVTELAVASLGDHIAKACQAWLLKSPSRDTRSNYERDIKQFLAFAGIGGDQRQRDDEGVRERPEATRGQARTDYRR